MTHTFHKTRPPVSAESSGASVVCTPHTTHTPRLNAEVDYLNAYVVLQGGPQKVGSGLQLPM